MFYNCENLTFAPKLRATTLADQCYAEMFRFCTSLTSALELRATTLAERCYGSMFYGCTKLSTVTMLAPSTQITGKIFNWLYKAGTDASVTSRTLKVQDADAYNALESNTDYLPAIWKKDAEGTIVKYKVDEEKNIE